MAFVGKASRGASVCLARNENRSFAFKEASTGEGESSFGEARECANAAAAPKMARPVLENEFVVRRVIQNKFRIYEKVSTRLTKAQGAIRF